METTENEQHYSTRERQTLIYKFLLENSNKDMAVSTKRIIDFLSTYEIKTHINTLYADLKEIELTYGVTITYDQRKKGYVLTGTLFDSNEIKLLAHGIQSSKFISEKQVDNLIKKLQTMTDSKTASSISKNVFVVGRRHSKSDITLINIEKINRAIDADSQIKFAYYYPRPFGKKEYLYDGKLVAVSPYRFIWAGGDLFLIAYVEENEKCFRAFNLERIEKITRPLEIPREGKNQYFRALKNQSLDNPTELLAVLENNDDNKLSEVKIRVKAEYAHIITNRFGKDTFIMPDGDCVVITKRTVVDPGFLGWLAPLGNFAKIVWPEEAVNKMRKLLREAAEVYKND